MFGNACRPSCTSWQIEHCAQFADWAFTHVAGKAGIIRAMEFDCRNVRIYCTINLLETLEVACGDTKSHGYAGLCTCETIVIR